MTHTAHQDTFVIDHLPPRDQWPAFLFDLPELQYKDHLNCATRLLDHMVAEGHGQRPVIHTPNESWTYGDLLKKSNQIAHVLVDDLGMVPGNRVLIRAANNPMFVACWFAIAKAGGVVVATMPLLRAPEISTILSKAQVNFALCDERLSDEMEAGLSQSDAGERVVYFNGSGESGVGAELEALMQNKPDTFENVDTHKDDPVLIAFTSGTTGKPKAAVHFHRDILAMGDSYSRHILQPTPNDVFIGSPPIAFTFGLGGLVTFPMQIGAATVLLEAASPPALLDAIERFKATVCVTSPTAYRMMVEGAQAKDLSSLKKCVSAGETLPLATFEIWRQATGLSIMDGIGTTEMIHIFIAAKPNELKPGATGKPVPGYQARVIDENNQPLPANTIGRLAVRGPTGCLYLDDERQTEYVIDGWNVTGDAYLQDEDDYFWFQARADDMIISGGYNISGPEVEGALMQHEAVADCAVVGAPDDTRGHIIKAFVVLREGHKGNEMLTTQLQDFVKNTIAPYKYPRAIEFVDNLPRTETGKVQRFKLRRQEEAKSL